MRDLYWLTHKQMARLQTFFCKIRSKPRVNDRRVVGDRHYVAEWFRDVLEAKSTQACIPDRGSHNEPVRYDKRRERRHSRIEIKFGRMKDCAA